MPEIPRTKVWTDNNKTRKQKPLSPKTPANVRWRTQAGMMTSAAQTMAGHQYGKQCTLLPAMLAAVFLITTSICLPAGLVEDVKRDTESLSRYPSRVPGTPGHLEAQRDILGLVAAVTNVRVWTQEFPVVAPVVSRATLTIPGGPLAGEHQVFPLWPDLVRLKTTPTNGLTGDIVYVSDGGIDELPARTLHGKIAVMEMSAGENWRKPFSMGALAVLMLGGPDDRAVQPAQQALYAPRYYIPEGPLAKALRGNEIPRATIFCEASWKTATGRNIYALVQNAPSTNPLMPVAVAAPYDSMSVVMGLAPGADNAVDTAFTLNMLRDTAANPPPRSVLFCFIDAYGFNQLGMRHMLTMLTATMHDTSREDYDLMEQTLFEDYYTNAVKIAELGDGTAAFERLGNKNKYRDLQRYFKDVVGPEIMDIKKSLDNLRLGMSGVSPEVKTRMQAEFDTKTARLRLLNGVLTTVLTRAPMNETMTPIALAAWKEVEKRTREQLLDLRAEMAYFRNLDGIRKEIHRAIGRTGSRAMPVSFLVGVDLSDAGTSCGPGLTCGHLISDETAQAKDFSKWIKPIFKEGTDKFIKRCGPLLALAVNRDAVAGLEDPTAFNIGRTALLTSPAASFKMPALTWQTVDSPRPRLDTPQDRADRLDWGRLGPQVLVTSYLLQRMFEDPAFSPTPRLSGKIRTGWCQPRGTVVCESVSETVPRTPKPGYLTTLVGGSNFSPGAPATPGIRRHEFVWTGPDGRFHFPPMAGHGSESVRSVRVQSFELSSDGRITGALTDTSSMIAARLSSAINLGEGSGSGPARVVSFPCLEVNGPEFFDPRYLEPLSQFKMTDVQRGATPKLSHFSIHQGQMFGLMAPDTKWQLMLRAGSGANRMVLMNINPALLGGKMSLREAIRTGFMMNEPLPSIPSHVSAVDLYRVDEWRADLFSKAGISSSAIKSLHDETAEWLAMADDALARDDGSTLQRAAAAALGTEIRAYDALRATGDDVTRGAIFLMILLVPFSVAMERLFFAAAKIGYRIILAVLIFMVMTLILWSFHPAFRITTQPLVIIMAFSILLLSVTVISMILNKFGEDLEKIRSGRAEASGAQTTRGGIIGSAVWLGVANMRKRKLRTALTGITIVLITFALLCFSSSTFYQSKRQFNLPGVSTPAPGVLIRQSRMNEMVGGALPAVANLLGWNAKRGSQPLTNGVTQVVPRYWLTSTSPNWRIHVRNPGTGAQVSLKAILGLHPGENSITRPDRFMKDWDRFAAGKGCYLAATVADKLGVKPGSKIVVAGSEFEVIDAFDSTKVGSDLKMLDGQSLLPFDYTVEREQSEEARRSDKVEAALASGVGLEPEKETAFVGGEDVIILPADFTRDIGGTLRSIAVATDTGDNAEKTALSLMKVLAFPMYYGEGSNIKAVVSTPLIPKPPRKLFIPILIAALIIFNTMLNSVTERKGEIHIYTSLGLAPSHVGMLFLAEAVTYGLMGSIFGYIVGQGFATVLNHLGLMGGITLNYSGTNVILTMSLVLIVVVTSAIVPAIMAGKLATPSKEMRWHVPQPKDGIILDMLPFTVTKRAAPGLVAFIHEYMDAHREGSIGHFTTDNLKVIPPDDLRMAALSGTVWLAPYDLGVRQDFLIEIKPEVEDICGIHISLTHGSGQTKTWWRLNHTFLGDVRRQLLGWRKVKAEAIMAYIKKAELGIT